MKIKKVAVPAGECGSARVVKFGVDPDSLEVLRLGGRAPRAGDYTALHINGRLMMSDTDAEMRDHYEAVRMATGRVLVNGLGLGMVANAMAAKPDVIDVLIIENNQDVIDLVSGSLHQKCKVVCGDAFDFKPPDGVRFGAVWHDIWYDLCTDNLPEMTKLKRKYGRRCDWQGCWGEEICRYELQRWKREGRRWGIA